MAGDKKVVIKINLPNSNDKDSVAGSSVRQVTEWNLKRLTIAGLILLFLLSGILYLFLSSDTSQDEDLYTQGTQEKINISKGENQATVDINETLARKEQIVAPVVAKTGQPLPQSSSAINQGLQADVKDKKDTGVKDTKDTGKLKSEIKKSPEVSEVDSIQSKPQEKFIANQWVARAQLAKNINNKEPSGHVELPFVVNRNRARALFYFTELKKMHGKTVVHQWNYQGKTVFERKINILGNRWRASTRKMISFKNPGEWNVRLLDGEGDILNEISFTVVIED